MYPQRTLTQQPLQGRNESINIEAVHKRRVAGESGSSTMKDTRTVIEAIGLTLLTASLVFVGYELYQTRSLSLGERIISGGEREMSLRGLIVDHADLWSRGCMGEELTREERIVFVQIFGGYYYKYFTSWIVSGTASGSPQAGEIAINTMAVNAHQFPGFREAWDTYTQFKNPPKGYMPEEFDRLVEARAKEIGSDPRGSEIALCGS